MTPRFSLSIRSILLTGFCGLSAFGILLALFLGLSTALHNTRDLLTENIEGFVDLMAREMSGRLKPVEQKSRWVAEQVASRSVDISLPLAERTDFFFRTVLATTPEANAIGVISPDGQFRAWAQGDDGRLEEDWLGNVGVADWLKEGLDNKASSWGPPVWIESISSAGIVYETSLYVDGTFSGYLLFAVPISDFSRFLSQVDKNAFVLFGEDDVLAHPLMIDWRPIDEGALPTANAIYNGRSALVPLQDLGDTILEEIWDAQPIGITSHGVQTPQDFTASFAKIGNREFIYIYRTLDGFGPKPLTVGTYLDAEAEDDVIDRMGHAAVAGIIVVIIAVVLGLFVARAIGRPVRALAHASAVVESGKLDRVPNLPMSHVSELNSAITSFEGMVKGLAEKEVIRRTLGRYVPESIAERLMKDDGSLEATILFSDIAGFTAMTEALGPTRIVEVLNAYFSRMTEIIEAEGGVITQFQGDAILAIFNVPIESPDHAERACRAAIRMRDTVFQEAFAGERISCRIGINTGNIVAGAVGAEGRLTYTVHGDAVNRAARVENMNKETGTLILITDTTARLVDDLPLRRVGEMQVRGQSDSVTVFTPEDTSEPQA